MKPSLAKPKTSRTQARNAALLNQLATPGLGSLLAQRWVAGLGQLLLAVIGFTLVLVWFVRMMLGYYGQMLGDGTMPHPPAYAGLLLGGGLFTLAWCWSLVTSFSLLRAVSRASLESLASFAAGQVKLEEEKIFLALAALPQWRRDGKIISRTFTFKDFPDAIKFVNDVADLAGQAQHHPDIDIRWNRVTLALTTHAVGGLTEKDFALARQCEAWSLR